MDLGTVKRNVDAQKYEKKGEFYDHVMLTFDNALTYNPKHDDCYKAASQLKQRFKDAWDRSFPPVFALQSTMSGKAGKRGRLQPEDDGVHV
jgi:hypothetical protein